MKCMYMHLSINRAAERKLAEMKAAMHVVDDEVGGLEEQQAELLRQLAGVQQQITAAKAKRVWLCGTVSVPTCCLESSCHFALPLLSCTNAQADPAQRQGLCHTLPTHLAFKCNPPRVHT